jgi:hypothetical protein
MMSASDKMRERAFMIEFDDWKSWEDVETDIATAEKIGFRTLAPTNDNSVMATVENHLYLFHKGFDVAYTYNLTNAVQARKTINTSNKIVPP